MSENIERFRATCKEIIAAGGDCEGVRCHSCPGFFLCDFCEDNSPEDLKRTVEACEKWLAEHPEEVTAPRKLPLTDWEERRIAELKRLRFKFRPFVMIPQDRHYILYLQFFCGFDRERQLL